VKHYKLAVDKIKVKNLQAPEMVAALERRDIDAFFLWEPWHTKAVQLVQGAHVLARSGDDNVYILTSITTIPTGLSKISHVRWRRRGHLLKQPTIVPPTRRTPPKSLRRRSVFRKRV